MIVFDGLKLIGLGLMLSVAILVAIYTGVCYIFKIGEFKKKDWKK